MRQRLTPDEVLEHVRAAGYGRSDRARQKDMLLASYDALVIGGFVTRSDVYLSAPKPAREAFEAVAVSRGQYWTPGRRSGLHSAVRRSRPGVPDMDVEVCVRYGPLESLYGDLFANLRSYELLLWGYLVGVLSQKFGGAQPDWRETGWWKAAVPAAERKKLIDDWGERTDVDVPWKIATFGTMEKMIDGKGRSALAAAEGAQSTRDFYDEVKRVSHIRNAVMHPLGGKAPQVQDFEFVTSALRKLAARAETALARQHLHRDDLPPPSTLMLTEILREHLDGGVGGDTGDRDT